MLGRADAGFKTAAQHAYEIICQKIIDGSLKPGDRLTRRGMAKTTGMSVIPVIEALHRLESEGLVVSEPHFGSRVIGMDTKTILDRNACRMAVECQVVRILAQHHHKDQVERLRLLARQLDEMPNKDGTRETFCEHHDAFHIQLATYTGYTTFVETLIRLNLFDSLLRISMERDQKKKIPLPAGHHQRLIEAIATGHVDVAENTMREHLNHWMVFGEEKM